MLMPTMVMVDEKEQDGVAERKGLPLIFVIRGRNDIKDHGVEVRDGTAIALSLKRQVSQVLHKRLRLPPQCMFDVQGADSSCMESDAGADSEGV